MKKALEKARAFSFIVLFIIYVVVLHAIGFIAGLIRFKNPFRYASKWAENHNFINVQ